MSRWGGGGVSSDAQWIAEHKPYEQAWYQTVGYVAAGILVIA